MQQEQKKIDKRILITKTLPGTTQGSLCFNVIYFFNCLLKAVLYITCFFFFFLHKCLFRMEETFSKCL